MVTVAKSFDAPIKLLFPKALLAETYSFSMLGLGDIVIPGIFIALLLRYDYHRNKRDSLPLETPYFTTTLIFYTAGLIFTIFIMHTFQAAQPALLYLVPACIGASMGRAFLEGDVSNLLQFEEKEEDKITSKKGNKKDTTEIPNKKDTTENPNKRDSKETVNKKNSTEIVKKKDNKEMTNKKKENTGNDNKKVLSSSGEKNVSLKDSNSNTPKTKKKVQ